MRGMTDLRVLGMEQNKFSGKLPSCVGAMRRLVSLSLGRNYRFAGLLPEQGLHGMSCLQSVILFSNAFEGTLPERGLSAMTSVFEFGVHLNKLKGALPEQGIGNMFSLEWMEMHANALFGRLPGHGLNFLTLLQHVQLSQNDLSGTLPEEGLRGLLDLRELEITENRFAGMLGLLTEAKQHRSKKYILHLKLKVQYVTPSMSIPGLFFSVATEYFANMHWEQLLLHR
eukprot:6473462-Amphidinium_carterae.1